MKKVIALIVAVVFALSMASFVFAADKPAAEDKCGKCHKGDKALDKIVGAKKIDSAAGLTKAAKEGPKAKLHEKLTEADLAEAAKTLKLK